ELNQPLNGIKIICQSTLRDKEKNRLDVEDLEHDLGDVVEQVDRMAEIIDHMRVYARHPEGTPMKKIDVRTAMENPFKIIGQQLQNHNIEVTKELSPDLLVIGDLIRLEQVFLNLITNARNAVESSRKENKRIELRAYKDDNRKAVIAEVMDNGIGVPEDLRGKIFQPFFTTREPGKGTGLGLSVASRIIEEHKGKIELESQVGEGAAFRVILPVAE
ncbi:sensor histidine kinase, partial [Candidatus Poribacteria bacterium]